MSDVESCGEGLTDAIRLLKRSRDLFTKELSTKKSYSFLNRQTLWMIHRLLTDALIIAEKNLVGRRE